jgi:Leucine Rich Repeat (LRR) protein/List-Bact-rpt repeat protein
MKKRMLSMMLVTLLLAVQSMALTDGDWLYTDHGDGTCVLNQYTGSDTEITIPSTLGGLEVIMIGTNGQDRNIFTDEQYGINNTVTSITVPEGVVSIGNLTFQRCSILSTVSLPDSLTRIGSYAFQECESIVEIVFPDALNSINDGAFSGCTSLKTINIPANVDSITKMAFWNCDNLTDITVDDANRKIYDIDGVLFEEDALLQYPGGKRATSYTVPDGVVAVAYGALAYSPTLESVTLPSSLLTIVKYAFYESSLLERIIIEGDAPVPGASSFENVASNFMVYYHDGASGFEINDDGEWVVDEDTYPITKLTDTADYVLTINGVEITASKNGGDVVAIEAAAPIAGRKFAKWTGDTQYITDVTASSTTITMLNKSIAVTATYEFDAETAEKLTLGIVVNVEAVDDLNLTQFTKRPKVYVTYGTDKKAPLRVLTKISSRDIETDFDAYWTKPVYLYDRKLFRNAYKNGVQFKDFTGQSTYIKMTMHVVTCEDGVKADTALERVFIFVPPEITSLEAASGETLVTPVSTEDTIVIKGKYFGNKAPKVWFEYTNAKGQIKMAKCKVLKPYAYADVKGKPAKSCMDKTTGISEITVKMPKRWPKDWVHGTNDIVIDNKIGMATDEIVTQ